MKKKKKKPNNNNNKKKTPQPMDGKRGQVSSIEYSGTAASAQHTAAASTMHSDVIWRCR